LAAVCNALSAVFQRKANRAAAERRKFGPRLLVQLLSDRAWLIGAAAMLCSFILQASALRVGTLSFVEPILVLELPLAIVIGALVLHRRLHRRDWVATAAMAAGLALLIGVLAPSGGDAASVSTTLAVAALAATAAGVLLIVLIGVRGPERSRAALLGAAAGSGWGLTASLMKLAVAQLSAGGVAGLFTAWQTYAMAGVGLGSLGLIQAALSAGTLVAAQPGITLLDPLVSLTWGTLVIGEDVRSSPLLVLTPVAAGVMVVSAIWLAAAAGRSDDGDGR
jgi:uncharacterized membrane protein